MKVRRDSPTGDPFLGRKGTSGRWRISEGSGGWCWGCVVGLMGLMGCLGTSWGCSGCLRMSFDVPSSPTTHSHTNGGRWDGDPERDSRPLWGDISGSSPHHSITHLRRTPHGETRGTPKGDTHGLPMRTPLRPPSDHPPTGPKRGDPHPPPHTGKGGKRGRKRGGKED